MKDEEVEKGLAQIRAASLQAALDGDHAHAGKLRAVHELVDKGRSKKPQGKSKK